MKINSLRHFFTLILAVTGILLNHAERFQFDEQFISSRLLLNWYNIETPAEITSYDTGTITLSQLGEQLYFGDIKLTGQYHTLLGAVSIDIDP